MSDEEAEVINHLFRAITTATLGSGKYWPATWKVTFAHHLIDWLTLWAYDKLPNRTPPPSDMQKEPK